MSAAEADVQQAFPPPPPYYLDFAAYADGSRSGSLPEPPPPIEGEYQLFGELHTVSFLPGPHPEGSPLSVEQLGHVKKPVSALEMRAIPCLEEVESFVQTEDGIPPLTVRPLFSVDATGSVEFRAELRKLNRELLFCFLDLINTLVERPSAYARSVENVGLVARNMHYLLNALRGHQARATLENILRDEVADGKQAVEDLRSAADRARHLLERSTTMVQHASLADNAGVHPALQTAAQNV